jgi:hypothetical protein
MSAPQPVPLPIRPAAEGQRTNRRLHARIPLDRPVCLCWRDRQGSHVLHARTRDISKFGMLVEAERGIVPGVVISVEANTGTLGNACVRHCTPDGLKYRIGLLMPDSMTSLMISTHAPR